VSRAKYILSVIAFVAAWALVGASSASATSCPNPDVQVTGLSQAQMESSIGCLINEERTSFGLQPVQPNSDLRQAALSHSQEMVDEGYFEHTSPAGLTFIDRIEHTGYMSGVRSWVVGENLVWGNEDLSTPQALVTAWMNSPPHRENLLRARFDEIGIAAVAGTPEDAQDYTGVTVSSEYGYRSYGRNAHSSKAPHGSKAHRAKAHKSKVRKRRHRKH
jgi:uncharacterized protein YkwD